MFKDIRAAKDSTQQMLRELHNIKENHSHNTNQPNDNLTQGPKENFQ